MGMQFGFAGNCIFTASITQFYNFIRVDILADHLPSVHILNQYWLTLIMVISMVLVSRTFVAGTRYSPILIIVVFGLIMGLILVSTGLATPGLPEFPIVDLSSRVTITALIASFFVGVRRYGNLLPVKR